MHTAHPEPISSGTTLSIRDAPRNSKDFAQAKGVDITVWTSVNQIPQRRRDLPITAYATGLSSFFRRTEEEDGALHSVLKEGTLLNLLMMVFSSAYFHSTNSHKCHPEPM
ncbi:hypothetical protein ILYODFUR_039007 [Ilyodon furcidens]|uniref:Uncharacterized protein n=1 Tax=Ilyodon furcidens TaxID=33524 RepID=A0ABV0UYU3_9TELE